MSTGGNVKVLFLEEHMLIYTCMKDLYGKSSVQYLVVPFLHIPIAYVQCSMYIDSYEETPYSAGVIYFVVQNLPRNERFKLDNIVLVGINPGPNEPKKHIKSSHC